MVSDDIQAENCILCIMSQIRHDVKRKIGCHHQQPVHRSLFDCVLSAVSLSCVDVQRYIHSNCHVSVLRVVSGILLLLVRERSAVEGNLFFAF